MGKMIGKAIYEKIVLEPQFSIPFLNSLIGRANTTDDMWGVDPQLHRSLMALKASSADTLATLALTFEVNTILFDATCKITLLTYLHTYI